MARPRKINPAEKVRLSFDVSRRWKDQLEELQRRCDLPTIIDTFRRGIVVLDLITTHHEEGGKVLLKNRDGTTETLKFT